MDLKGKKFLVVGGGVIGSHVVDALLKEDIKAVTVYDNFSRGSRENLEDSIKDVPPNEIYAGNPAKRLDRI